MIGQSTDEPSDAAVAEPRWTAAKCLALMIPFIKELDAFLALSDRDIFTANSDAALVDDGAAFLGDGTVFGKASEDRPNDTLMNYHTTKRPRCVYKRKGFHRDIMKKSSSASTVSLRASNLQQHGNSADCKANDSTNLRKGTNVSNPAQQNRNTHFTEDNLAKDDFYTRHASRTTWQQAAHRTYMETGRLVKEMNRIMLETRPYAEVLNNGSPSLFSSCLRGLSYHVVHQEDSELDYNEDSIKSMKDAYTVLDTLDICRRQECLAQTMRTHVILLMVKRFYFQRTGLTPKAMLIPMLLDSNVLTGHDTHLLLKLGSFCLGRPSSEDRSRLCASMMNDDKKRIKSVRKTSEVLRKARQSGYLYKTSWDEDLEYCVDWVSNFDTYGRMRTSRIYDTTVSAVRQTYWSSEVDTDAIVHGLRLGLPAKLTLSIGRGSVEFVEDLENLVTQLITVKISYSMEEDHRADAIDKLFSANTTEALQALELAELDDDQAPADARIVAMILFAYVLTASLVPSPQDNNCELLDSALHALCVMDSAKLQTAPLEDLLKSVSSYRYQSTEPIQLMEELIARILLDRPCKKPNTCCAGFLARLAVKQAGMCAAQRNLTTDWERIMRMERKINAFVAPGPNKPAGGLTRSNQTPDWHKFRYDDGICEWIKRTPANPDGASPTTDSKGQRLTEPMTPSKGDSIVPESLELCEDPEASESKRLAVYKPVQVADTSSKCKPEQTCEANNLLVVERKTPDLFQHTGAYDDTDDLCTPSKPRPTCIKRKSTIAQPGGVSTRKSSIAMAGQRQNDIGSTLGAELYLTNVLADARKASRTHTHENDYEDDELNTN